MPEGNSCVWPECQGAVIGEKPIGLGSYEDIGAHYCSKHALKAVTIRLAVAGPLTVVNPVTGELRNCRASLQTAKYLDEGWRIQEQENQEALQ